MLRVRNLDESIAFYEAHFGMKLLRKNDYPEGKFTLAFLGYGDESQETVLEFTYNWGVDHYDIGTAYGHIAIGVDDLYAVCERIKITRRKNCPLARGSETRKNPFGICRRS
jgi:lactoylglutathione lyase